MKKKIIIMKMEMLNKDEIYLVAMKLDDHSLLNFCASSKKGKELCENDNFWKARTMQKYGNVPKRTNETWKNFYMRKTRQVGQELDQSLYDAARQGKMVEVVRLLNLGADSQYGLDGALFTQNQELAEFIRKF